MKPMLEKILDIAVQAGEKILEIYENEFDVDFKGDGSPLTMADRSAHQLIQRELQVLDPTIPVMSEESGKEAFAERLNWSKYWMVDPLDGTKEFVKRNGEFTVNIALIDEGVSVLGVVHTPVKDYSHFAATGVGAFKKTGLQSPDIIRTRLCPVNETVMVSSRSHSGVDVERFRLNLEKTQGEVEIASMGSSLKICLIAEGSADIYPRLGPTSEWDTAAAQCVLEVAGGQITDLNGQRLAYSKQDILNPWFLASGDSTIDWTRYLEDSTASKPARSLGYRD
jgi:3'(2'), 5'-bisphosphate nucleotidase